MELIWCLDCFMCKFNVIQSQGEVWNECKNNINRYGRPSSIVQREVKARMNMERARSMGSVKDQAHSREPSVSDIARRISRREPSVSNRRIERYDNMRIYEIRRDMQLPADAPSTKTLSLGSSLFKIKY